MARAALTRCSPANIPFAGAFLGVLTKLPPSPVCVPGAGSSSWHPPRGRTGRSGLPPSPGLAPLPRRPRGHPQPAPPRSPGSDRVVVGVPQADGVREEAAGEVQRHALHVADGAHGGRARPRLRGRGHGGSAGRGGRRARPPPTAARSGKDLHTQRHTGAGYKVRTVTVYFKHCFLFLFFSSIRTYITKFIVEVYMHDLTHKYQYCHLLPATRPTFY